MDVFHKLRACAFFISQHGDATLREFFNHVGITERATHRIVAHLEQAGFIYYSVTYI